MPDLWLHNLITGILKRPELVICLHIHEPNHHHPYGPDIDISAQLGVGHSRVLNRSKGTLSHEEVLFWSPPIFSPRTVVVRYRIQRIVLVGSDGKPEVSQDYSVLTGKVPVLDRVVEPYVVEMEVSVDDGLPVRNFIVLS